MEDNFFIPVQYKGKDFNYPARLIKSGYIYRIEIDVDGEKVLLEPDEERQYRVISESNTALNLDIDLLKEVVRVIEEAST
jgi:cell division protein FtsB